MKYYLKKKDMVEIYLKKTSQGKRIVKYYTNPGVLVSSQLKAEVDFFRQYSHPYFVPLVKYRFDERSARFEYEYFDGLPINIHMERHPEDIPILWEKLFHFVRYLKYHNTFIGDMKPEHIRVRREEDDLVIGIIDLTPHESRITPQWAAPEQMKGRMSWRSNLFTIALIFASLYSSADEIKEKIEQGQTIQLPQASPLFRLAHKFLALDPWERVQDLDEWIARFSECDKILTLPYDEPYNNYLEFHQRLSDLFYTDQFSYRETFELYRRYCLIHPFRRTRNIEQFKVDANHKISLQKIIAESGLGWKNGKVHLPEKPKLAEEESLPILEATRQLREAMEVWDFDTYVRLGNDLLNRMRYAGNKQLEDIGRMPADDFIVLHRYFLTRNFTLAARLLRLYAAQDNLQPDQIGKLRVHLYQANVLSDIVPMDMFPVTPDILKKMSVETRSKLTQIEKVREIYRSKDLRTLNDYCREEKLYPETRIMVYHYIDVLCYISPEAFDRKVFVTLSNYIAAQTDPEEFLNTLAKAKSRLKLADEYLDYLLVLSLLIGSEYQIGRLLFYYLYHTAQRSVKDIELILNFYEKISIQYLPMVMQTHFTSVQVYHDMLRERYDICRERIIARIRQSHGYATAYMIQVFLICSFYDHEFTFEPWMEKLIDDNARELSSYFQRDDDNTAYLIYRFAPEDVRKRYSARFEMNGSRFVATKPYQKIIDLFFEERYQEVIRYSTQIESKSGYERAESYYWTGLALERMGNPELAIDFMQNALETFNYMGLKSRSADAQTLLQDWELRRRQISRLDINDIIEKFSSISHLDEFLRELGSFFQLTYRFDSVIPFIYNEESGRFVPFRNIIHEDEESYRALEYSNNILLQYTQDAYHTLQYDSSSRFRNDSIQKLRIYRALCVPMVVGAKLLGTIYMHSVKRDHSLSEEDIRYIENLASILGVFLEHLNQKEMQKRLRDIEVQESFHGIVGKSQSMKEIYKQIVTLANVPFPVLITGETGTGKEMVARAVYQEGNYKGDLISINVSTIPRDLFESEIFGHMKGSFSGAIKDFAGKIALAEDGVLFLDEIGDLPLDMQTKLLRVLQEKTYYPIGAKKEHRSNARILFATNRDLYQAVKTGEFREDLYYRISAFQVNVPPLRERLEDIPLLVRHFTRNFMEIQPDIIVTGIPDDTISQWIKENWSGNIRELENRVYKVLLMPRRDRIDNTMDGFEIDPETIGSVDDLVAAYLQWRKDCLGSAKKVQDELGLTRSTFYRLLANKKDE